MNREDPFGGSWKLNCEKSHFDPNHHPSRATMRWDRTSDGYYMTAEGTMDDGKTVQERPATFTLDGKDHPIPEMPGFTKVMSRPVANTIEVESKNAGLLVGKASYVVSSDGTT